MALEHFDFCNMPLVKNQQETNEKSSPLFQQLLTVILQVYAIAFHGRSNHWWWLPIPDQVSYSHNFYHSFWIHSFGLIIIIIFAHMTNATAFQCIFFPTQCTSLLPCVKTSATTSHSRSMLSVHFSIITNIYTLRSNSFIINIVMFCIFQVYYYKTTDLKGKTLVLVSNDVYKHHCWTMNIGLRSSITQWDETCMYLKA